MINDPMGIIMVLLVIEGAILYTAGADRAKRLFKYVPAMFWIYFLPMLANTIGLIPPRKDIAVDVHGAITTYCLPACLVLLLISVDLRAIYRLGAVAIAVMLAGSLGTLVGGPVVMLIFGRWLPPDIWSGIGALSASWMGGSSNMIAVAESVDTPAKIYGTMIVVDTIIPYAWMGLLIFLSAHQARFDRWNRAKSNILDDLKHRAAGAGAGESEPITLRHFVVMFAVAAVGTYAAIQLAELLSVILARLLPATLQIVSPSAWAIILASVLGLLLSFTPVRRLERFGASKVGYGLLYFVLASIGARTSLASLADAPLMIVVGVVWVLIHGAFILAAGRLFRAPMALMAAASQANMGGTASAPVVAEIYHPGLAPVGLLLAVLGSIVGTYLGIFCAHICRFLSG
ncbi:MAG: DUF819 family protein [Phycisphaerae bacterium]|jgi:uncharacterized membrane protein|nr:DUF819 family protein [Phycisphaerae bacterium]